MTVSVPLWFLHSDLCAIVYLVKPYHVNIKEKKKKISLSWFIILFASFAWRCPPQAGITMHSSFSTLFLKTQLYNKFKIVCLFPCLDILMKTPTKPELTGFNLVADFPTCFLESDSLTETMDVGGAERVGGRYISSCAVLYVRHFHTRLMIVIQWSIRSYFMVSQWIMPYPVWKCLMYGIAQSL